jgi:hypothetical protein
VRSARNLLMGVRFDVFIASAYGCRVRSEHPAADYSMAGSGGLLARPDPGRRPFLLCPPPRFFYLNGFEWA